MAQRNPAALDRLHEWVAAAHSGRSVPSPDPNDVMVLLMLVQMSGMVGPSDRYILDETPEEDEAPTSLTERTFIID